jgi:hypothetical protein
MDKKLTFFEKPLQVEKKFVFLQQPFSPRELKGSVPG